MCRMVRGEDTSGHNVTLFQDGVCLHVNGEPADIEAVTDDVVTLTTKSGKQTTITTGLYWHAWHGHGSQEPDARLAGSLMAKLAMLKQQDAALEQRLLAGDSDGSDYIALKTPLPCEWQPQRCGNARATSALIARDVRGMRCGRGVQGYVMLPICAQCKAERERARKGCITRGVS